MVSANLPVFLALQLRQHFRVAHNGAGNQLWKKADEKRIIHKVYFVDFPAINISDKGYLLKGKKRNAQG